MPVIDQQREVQFGVEDYDRRKTLVIDPVLSYSTFLGGSGIDGGKGIALDASGNAYVTGFTQSTDFPTVNPFQANSGAGLDAFVTKLDPTGTSLLYSTYLGGSADDFGLGITVDGAGSAYLTGYTSSSNFPTLNAFQKTCSACIVTAFVTKLDPSGSKLEYSTYLGGGIADIGTAIAVDGTGSAYVTGRTFSNNFPTTPGAYDTTCGTDGNCNTGFYDGFITKLSTDGKTLVYSTYLGGSSDDYPLSIAVDSSGNTYAAGFTYSTDFPTTPGGFLQTCSCDFGEGFVTKLNPSGSALVYSTFLGGTKGALLASVAVDGSGNAYVTGETEASDFPTTPGALQTTNNGGLEAVVTKLNSAGSALAYSTYLDGSKDDSGLAIAVNSTGSAYVLGGTTSPNFPTVAPLQAACAGPVTLASTGSCAISVTFAPTHNGNRTGLLTVADNDVLSPQTAALTGSGSGAFLSVTPGNLSFGEQGRGTSSTQTVLLADLDKHFGESISSIAVTGNPDFAQTNNCPPSLTALGYGGSSCTISVTFKPSALAAETATLTIVAGLTYTVPLSGTGMDFSISASASALSVAAGGTATFTLSVVPQGGFNLATNLRCSVSPFVSGPACSVAPTSVTPNGSTAATATVTVTTTARSASSAGMTQRTLFPDSRLWSALACIPAFACVFIGASKRGSGLRRRAGAGISVVLLFAVLSFGCGGGSSSSAAQSGTPAGTYTLTATGTSGTLTHAVNLTLKVN